MNRLATLLRLSLIPVLVTLALLPAAWPAQAQEGLPPVVPDEYILHYAPGASEAEIDALVGAAGGVVVERIEPLNAIVIRVTSPAGRAALAAEQEVVYLEPNAIRYPTITPDDPDYSTQWGLDKIDAPAAWDVTLGTGQVIAVLDTGVDLDHPDLAGHLLAGWDYVDGDSNPSPNSAFSNSGHGTHVTGIANALTDNAAGVAGVAWDARTMPVRIIGSGGASSANIALGIIYATDHGATVINMSLGGPGWIKVERDAVNYAAAHGVVIVASAGNDSLSVPYFPASYDHVINVASTTSSDALSSFSNTGTTIDIAAPGSAIYSTYFDPAQPAVNTYIELSGTSMAAPHVAGAAALVRAAGHADTLPEITAALLCTAQDLGTSGWDPSFGWGRLEADAAVNYISGATSCLPIVDNDDFDNPRVISPSFFSDTVNTVNATSWEDDPNSCAGSNSRTVWYRFTAPSSGTLDLNTFGSTYNTVLGVYSGARGSLTQLACNDNTSSSTASAVQVYLTAGQQVSVAVSAYDFEDDTGTLTLNLVVPSSYCVPLASDSATIICVTG